VQRVEAALRHRFRARAQAADMLLPGGDRVALVEPHRVGDVLEQALDVRASVDPLGPAVRRIRRDRPVDALLLEDDLERAFAVLLRPGPAHAGAVEVGEQIGIRVARDRDHRAAHARKMVQALQLPRRRPLERLVGAVRDQLPPHVLVAVGDGGVAGARLVRRADDRTRELRVLHEGEHDDVLALLDVGADPDDEVGVLLQKRLVGHRHRL